MDTATNEETQNPQESVENGGVNHEVSGTLAQTSRLEMILRAKETGV